MNHQESANTHGPNNGGGIGSLDFLRRQCRVSSAYLFLGSRSDGIVGLLGPFRHRLILADFGIQVVLPISGKSSN